MLVFNCFYFLLIFFVFWCCKGINKKNKKQIIFVFFRGWGKLANLKMRKFENEENAMFLGFCCE